MATPPEQPWTNREKNYLLAEIIKAANVPAENLFNLIRGLNIQPRWEDIPLPAGRSLNSSRHAFDDLWRSLSSQSMLAPHTPTPVSAPVQTLKRPYSFDGMYSAGGGAREIRPRPPQSSVLYPQPSSEPAPKRKRGRPTKAEQAAKEEAKVAAAAAAAAAAGGESAPAPISRPATQTPVPTQAPMLQNTPETKPAMAAAARMPIAAMLTPTAHETKSASNSSSSSSGKRRRARSNRSELEGGGNGYDSPYGGRGPGVEDSPARTAILRHREEQPTSVPRIERSSGGGRSYTTYANPSPH